MRYSVMMLAITTLYGADCSMPMPRMAVDARIDSKMVMPFNRGEVREKFTMPSASVPAPECPAERTVAAAPIGQPANLSPLFLDLRVIQQSIRPNPFGEFVKLPKIDLGASPEKPGNGVPAFRWRR